MRRVAVSRTMVVAVVIILLVVASFAAYDVFLSEGHASCLTIPSGGVRTQIASTTFGAVTEYMIPGQDRWPNAITTDEDGSVWFAEQVPPGVAHLYPSNGTLVEYSWPGLAESKPPDCPPTVNLSGIAVWNGWVWAADEFGNLIIGVNPGNGATFPINSTAVAPFPYWLAGGPDGNLWFTSSNLAGQPTRLGMVLPNMTVRTVDLLGLGDYQPVQLEFVNATLAYLSTINEATNATTHSCDCTGHVYSFNPSAAGQSLTPRLVGGGARLLLTTSVSYAAGTVWVAQHGGSNLVGYNLTAGAWETFPTSLVTWSDVTLPLEVDSNQKGVWFNEHIANKIALLSPSEGTLTEYSESEPPAAGSEGIQNDLSIAATAKGLWFTSMSGNYVGFVNGSVDPGFHIGALTNHATIAPGGNRTFTLAVSGTVPDRTAVNFSDSEGLTSIPALIQISRGEVGAASGTGAQYTFQVSVRVGQGIHPGPYTVAVTLAVGGVQQTAYLFIDVP